MLSGFALDTVYATDTAIVGDTLELINRDGVYGYIMRNAHANTPSLLFLFLYCH